jgi:hypothetical protein
MRLGGTSCEPILDFSQMSAFSAEEMLLVSPAGSTFQYVPEWYKWATFGIEVCLNPHCCPACVCGSPYEDIAMPACISSCTFLELNVDLSLIFCVCLKQYHHIHHFSTKVPSYQLRPCHDTAPPGVITHQLLMMTHCQLTSCLPLFQQFRELKMPRSNGLISQESAAITCLTHG